MRNDTYSNMISEPIVGHRYAQDHADHLSGIATPHCTSNHTKWLDYAIQKQHIQDMCCKLQLGELAPQLACSLYGRVRYMLDRLEKPRDTAAACIILASRMTHC